MRLATFRIRIRLGLTHVQKVGPQSSNRFFAYQCHNCIQQESNYEEAVIDVEIANVLLDFHHPSVEQSYLERAWVFGRKHKHTVQFNVRVVEYFAHEYENAGADE